MGGVVRIVTLMAATLMWYLFSFNPSLAAEKEDKPIKAGIASKVITPKEPLWMGGYSSRNKPAEEKQHDLRIKALALEDNRGEKFVLVTSDLLGFPRELSDQVAEAVHKKTGLPHERLMLTSSHTHCGPVVSGLLFDMYDISDEQKKKITAYTEQLRGWLVEIVAEALDDLKPAKLSIGMGKAKFAVNRREVTPKGIINGTNPSGPVDHEVPVLRVESPDGKLRAVVFGYACHNTTLQYYKWCGDYAGFAQAELEEKHPGAQAMFFMGCGGDSNPLPRSTVELCQKYGHELAEAVEAVLKDDMTPVRGSISARYATIALPLDHLPSEDQIAADLESKQTATRNLALHLRKILENGGKVSNEYSAYPVQVWRLGDKVLWVALGGEVVVDYSLRLKKELAQKDRPAVWVTAYANDVMAYIPSERVLKEGGYEGASAMVYYGLPGVWKEGIEKKIVEKVHALAKETKAEPGPLSPREEAATFQVPKGFKVELVASEPDVVDPVAIAFDEDGRLFVAEMRGYPNGGVATGQIASGTIKLLEDPDENGKYKKCTTFAEGLRFPTSVMPWKGGLLVCVAPDIIYYPDATKTGPGKPRTLYTGFDLENIQQLVNSLQWGLDNWVYGCAGGKGGTIHSVEKRDAPEVTLRGRGIRFHPEEPGSLEPMSSGGQFGLAADAFERWFTATNSQHLRHIVLPDHYLRRNLSLPVSAVTLDIPDHDAACKVFRISPFEAWRVERTTRRAGGPDARRFPSTELVPGGFITSACSPVVYTADLFPEGYRGNTFVCDPANNLVHRDILEQRGATFVARRGEADHDFLASTDTWFRPVNLTIGPDGALYIVDFYREVIETPLSLPDDIKKKLNLESRGRGRIWRIVPEDAPKYRKPELRKDSAEELVKLLADPNSWQRLTAQRLLVERQDPKAVQPLEELARKCKSAPGRAHALWTLHGQKALTDELIEAALKDENADVREQALRLADERMGKSEKVRQGVIRLADDPSPRVRFQLAFTLGETNTPETVDALAELIRRDAADPWTQTAILSSADKNAPGLLESLAHDPKFTRTTSEPQLQLIKRLASLVGARADDKDLADALNLLGEKKDSVESWQVAVLEGLGQGMQNSPRPLKRLWDDPPAALKEPVANARPFFERAATTAADEKRPIAERMAAVRLLGYGPFSACAKLSDLLEPTNSTEIQLAAVRVLSLHDDAKAGEMLLSPWSGFSPIVRREAFEALLARPGRIKQLLDAVEKKQILVSQLDAARVDQLRKHPEETIRKRAQALLASQVAPTRQKVVEEYRAALELKPDFARGKALFKKTCATCHRLENEGVEVGPDLLSALRNKTPKTLLIDILDPSREVDPRYVNYIVDTKAGRRFTGMIAVETPSSITLRRAEKAEDTILRSQIETVQATNKSLMPDDMEKLLSKQEMADIIGYLQSVAAPNTEPPFYPDKTKLLIYLDGDKEQPVKTAADWKKRRDHILANLQLVMGPLTDDSRKVALDVKVEEEVRFDKFTRKKITLAVEKGDRVSAYLLIPKGLKGKVPAMLCLHQTTKIGKGEPAGIEGSKNLNYARELAERGYVALAPDYPNFGDYQCDPYELGYQSATMKGIWNHMRAVDLLQSLDEVDGERIGVIGHSLGGHNSLFVAVFDPRLKVVVTSCGFNTLPKYYKGDLTGWSHKGYMPRIASVYGKDPKKMPFDFPEIIGALAPRPVFINAPLKDANFEVTGVRDCVDAAMPVYELFGAKEKLVVSHPDCEHAFPPEVRKTAYEFVDKALELKR
jgi:putative membrane-bound dehydrogenase-like protein